MLLTEPSQKTLAEPLQKTLLRGDGRKKNPDFLVKLQLFGKAPVTVAKTPLPHSQHTGQASCKLLQDVASGIA